MGVPEKKQEKEEKKQEKEEKKKKKKRWNREKHGGSKTTVGQKPIPPNNNNTSIRRRCTTLHGLPCVDPRDPTTASHQLEGMTGQSNENNTKMSKSLYGADRLQNRQRDRAPKADAEVKLTADGPEPKCASERASERGRGGGEGMREGMREGVSESDREYAG